VAEGVGDDKKRDGRQRFASAAKFASTRCIEELILFSLLKSSVAAQLGFSWTNRAGQRGNQSVWLRFAVDPHADFVSLGQWRR
jgi:hypothetical protein